MNKSICAALIIPLLLCGCSGGGENSYQTEKNFSEESFYAESETDKSPADDETGSGQKTADNRVVLEALIMEASDKPDNYAVRISTHGDFDGDGKNELFAVYGSEENNFNEAHLTSSVHSAYGELWFADDEGAVLLYTEDEWMLGQFVDLGDIAIMQTERYMDRQSFYFRMVEGRPERMETFQLKDLNYVGGRDFVGYYSEYDTAENTPSYKPYWFYIEEGWSQFLEYRGTEITLEEFSEYEGSQHVLDLISLEVGSEITGILYRDNGIININYKADALGVQFKTLKILEDGSLEDITPSSNKGRYSASASGKYTLDYIMY